MRVTEAVREDWKLDEHFAKIRRDGSDQKKEDDAEGSEKFAQKMRAKILADQQRSEDMKNISKKHITEFANDQYTNFATVLGLPEISLEDLSNKKDQREPIVSDAIREKSYFSKQTEGYPTFFSTKKMEGGNIGLHTDKIGLTDFYQSLWITPKVNAALYQAFENIREVMTPENGYATTCLEICFLKEAREMLKKMHEFHDRNGQMSDVEGQSLIEEDFYLANSDKIVFAMKELKADMDPTQLYKRANPVVMSKLDIRVSTDLCFISHLTNLTCIECPKLQLPKDQHR